MSAIKTHILGTVPAVTEHVASLQEAVPAHAAEVQSLTQEIGRLDAVIAMAQSPEVNRGLETPTRETDLAPER